jgi:hypothetical protein
MIILAQRAFALSREIYFTVGRRKLGQRSWFNWDKLILFIQGHDRVLFFDAIPSVQLPHRVLRVSASLAQPLPWQALIGLGLD